MKRLIIVTLLIAGMSLSGCSYGVRLAVETTIGVMNHQMRTNRTRISMEVYNVLIGKGIFINDVYSPTKGLTNV